ncbi:MAG: hypothetical protein ACREH7_01730, partial [Candidatus Rokuibacteriota bacterium]
SERTLLLVHEGDGSALDRTHLRACLGCAARYQRLIQDLQVIGHALRGAPPAAALSRPRVLPWRSFAAAAALAALALFVGVEAWMWRESVLWVSPKPSGGDTETLAFLEEVSRTLSSTGDATGVATVMLSPAPDLADVAGGPEVQWSDESE